MKKIVKSISVVAIASVFVFFACEKEEIEENQEKETISDVNSEIKGFDDDRAYRGYCGLCYQRTEVCVSPTGDSWDCFAPEDEWGWGESVYLSFTCSLGDSISRIKLFSLTDETPVETFCFYMDLPINVTSTLTFDGWCGPHDELCDIDVTFTTTSPFGTTCVTEVTYENYDDLPFCGSEPFEICSDVACSFISDDDVFKIP